MDIHEIRANDSIGRRGGFPTRPDTHRPNSESGDHVMMRSGAVSADSVIYLKKGRLETCRYGFGARNIRNSGSFAEGESMSHASTGQAGWVKNPRLRSTSV